MLQYLRVMVADAPPRTHFSLLWYENGLHLGESLYLQFQRPLQIINLTSLTRRPLETMKLAIATFATLFSLTITAAVLAPRNPPCTLKDELRALPQNECPETS
jgi:hypothetical protein